MALRAMRVNQVHRLGILGYSGSWSYISAINSFRHGVKVNNLLGEPDRSICLWVISIGNRWHRILPTSCAYGNVYVYTKQHRLWGIRI